MTSSVSVLTERPPISVGRRIRATPIGPLTEAGRNRLQVFTRTITGSPYEQTCIDTICAELLASRRARTAPEIWASIAHQHGLEDREEVIFVLFRNIFSHVWSKIAGLAAGDD